MVNGEAGKGDSYRSVDAEKFAEGYALAFGRCIYATDSRGNSVAVRVDASANVRPDGWKVNADGYAYRETKGYPLLLHRFIAGAQPGEVVDHANGNRLDNRSGNLRKVTRQQNAENLTRLKSNNRSGYRGVSWDKSSGKWLAAVRFKGQRYTRTFADKEKAALWAASKRAELGFLSQPRGQERPT